MIKGMDIYCWEADKDNPNKIIDFRKAKADGIDFIIPRDGWGTEKIDPKLIEYVQNAQDQNIDVPGVYHFIYATDINGAVNNAVRAIKNVKAAGLPQSTIIWCDIEYDTVDNAKKQGVTLTPTDLKNMMEAFCNTCLAEGYPTGIYCNRDYLENIYGKDIMKKYDIWLADLEGDPDYPCLYRQYDWHGLPDGCRSEVDLDVFIGEYTAGTAKPRNTTTENNNTTTNTPTETTGGNMIKASALLTQIHDVVDNIPTVYHQCENFGGWNSQYNAFNQDCIVWIKSMVYWDWYYPDKNRPNGGMTYRGEYDWTEDKLLAHSSNVKYNGFLSAKPCELLYMKGHCGFKIDEFTRDGRTYNAAECTWASAWGTPARCVYSYVDDYGGRYNYKGGIQNGSWTAHGELYGVEYDSAEPSGKHLNAEELAAAIMSGYLDGQRIGNEPQRSQFLRSKGYTDAEIRAAQDIVNGKAKPKETHIELTRFINFLPAIQKGSTGDSVKLLQNCLCVLDYYSDAVDGSAGPNTDKAIKAYQSEAGLCPDGVFDTEDWTKLLIG